MTEGKGNVYYETDFSDNFFWSEFCYSKCYPEPKVWSPNLASIIPVEAFALGMFLGGFCVITSRYWTPMESTPNDRLKHDTIAFHCIGAINVIVAWLYITLSRTFVTPVIQPLMIAFFWVPPILVMGWAIVSGRASRALIGDPCPAISCKLDPASFSGLFSPLVKLLLVILMIPIVTFYLAIYVAAIIIVCIAWPHTLVSTASRFADNVILHDDPVPYSYGRLTMSVLVNLVSFAIPELILMAVNQASLPGTETSLACGPFIIFVIFFTLEVILLGFLLARASREGSLKQIFFQSYRPRQPRAALNGETTSATRVTQERQKNGGTRATSGAFPRRGEEKRDVELAETNGAHYPKHDHLKQLHDDFEAKYTMENVDYSDLDEPEWMNPSVHRAGWASYPSSAMGLQLPRGYLIDKAGSPHVKTHDRDSSSEDVLRSKNPYIECAVCFQSEISKVALGCGHLLCKDCLLKIKADKNECPLCKQDITLVVDLYI